MVMTHNFGQILLLGGGHMCVACRQPAGICTPRDIAADSHLHRTGFGHYCLQVDLLGWVPLRAHVRGAPSHFFFLKARRAVMGPAKRGPIWAG